MELRTLLYGYNKRQFRFYLNETESTVVKQIFDDYISGLTLQKIADRLTSEQVVYYKDKATWNKHMVRRILENRHYAGDEEYPAIVTCAVFEQANEKRLRKGGDRETDSEQEKYFKVASEFLLKKGNAEGQCRFDVIEIQDGQINHIINAFCS